MKRIAITVVAIVLLAGLFVIDYKGYQSLKAMKSQIVALKTQMHQTSELAQRESAATLAASHRAEEAAAQAEIASGARKQAEQQREQAEMGRAQAETAAQQASNQARQANDEAQRARDEVAQMRLEREKELNRMQEALNSIVETHRTPNGMVMVLPDSIFRFNFDSSELNQRNRELLSRIAGILLVSKGYGLSVYGYTDDIGTAEYNQSLSVRRAKAVEDYLVQAGIDQSIVSIKGYGKANPLVPSTSASARAKNRRVEIALTDSSITFTGEATGTSR